MNDHLLSLAAASIEIGLTGAVAAAVIVGIFSRRRTVVVLGALTPTIFAMAYVAYVEFVIPTPGSMAGAGWVMGFAAYVVILVGGAVASFVPRPANLYARYLLGLLSAPISLALLVLV